MSSMLVVLHAVSTPKLMSEQVARPAACAREIGRASVEARRAVQELMQCLQNIIVLRGVAARNMRICEERDFAPCRIPSCPVCPQKRAKEYSCRWALPSIGSFAPVQKMVGGVLT